jgi:hypothetical protein
VTRNHQLKDNLEALKAEIDGTASLHGPSGVIVINYGEARSYSGERALKDFAGNGVFAVVSPLHVTDGAAAKRKRDVLSRCVSSLDRKKKIVAWLNFCRRSKIFV